MCNLLPIHSINAFLGSPAPDGAHASPLRVVSFWPDGSSHRQVPAGSALFPRSQSAHTATANAVSCNRLARSDCCHDGGLSVGFGGCFHNAKQARTPTQFYYPLCLGTRRRTCTRRLFAWNNVRPRHPDPGATKVMCNGLRTSWTYHSEWALSFA